MTDPKRTGTGTHEDAIRYERIADDDPDRAARLKCQRDQFEADASTNEIQLYDTVEAIAARYERRKAEIEKAVTVTTECSVELKKDYLTEHKAESWREILDKSNARQWMTTEQEGKVTAMLYDKPKELPEITVEGLRSWLEDLVTSSPEMIRSLCREAFEILTPQKRNYGPDYKSNEDKREIPKSGRVILRWMCESNKWENTPSISFSRTQPLNVLDRVFSLLDGRAKPERDATTYELCRKATAAGESEVNAFWGRLKMHLNGNLHIWLTQPDLIKRLTATAAGKNLTGKAA